MQRPDKFVWEQNLSRFASQLYVETDPARLEVLRDLLIKEEDRFGALAERLDKADSLILEAKVRVGRQAAFVSGLSDGDPRHASAGGLLLAMRQTLDLLEQHRAILARELDRAGP